MKGGGSDLNCPAHTADKRSRYKPPSCVYPICLIQLPQGSSATEGILATTAQNATSLNHASMPLLRCVTELLKLAGWPSLATLLRGYVTWKISSFPWVLEIPVCRTKAPARQRFVEQYPTMMMGKRVWGRCRKKSALQGRCLEIRWARDGLMIRIGRLSWTM